MAFPLTIPGVSLPGKADVGKSEVVSRCTVAFCLGGAWLAMIGAIFLILLDDLALADLIAVGSRID